MRILVTGATGFVGGAFLRRSALDPSLQIVAAIRRDDSTLPAHVVSIRVGELGAGTDWSRALVGVEAVVHSAARVHVMRDDASDPLTEFRAVNVEGTLRLARDAARAGVKRFVFVSSVKVNGEHTLLDKPFTSNDAPAPVDAYGISKHEAEEGLRREAATSGLNVVIIRPVLVYGPGVKANFRSMMRWVHRGFPLPLGAIHNRRILVAADNLADFIFCALSHPAAANQTFHVSDGEDLSTTELLRRTALAMGKRPRLLPVPRFLLSPPLRAIGKAAVANRLFDSLVVDIGKNRDLLGWSPPVSVNHALGETVAHYLAHERQ